MADVSAEEQYPRLSQLVNRGMVAVRASEALDQLGDALAKAQGQISNPHKGKTATVPMKSGGKFQYRYADIADGLDVIRPTLSKHGLSLLQVPVIRNDMLVICTRLLHCSGQWIEGEYPVSNLTTEQLNYKTGEVHTVPTSHQDMGSAMTYARRQAAFAMVGIAGDEDTDGQQVGTAAHRHSPATLPRQQSAPRPRPQQPPAKAGGITPEDMRKADPAQQGTHPDAFDSSGYYNRLTFNMEKMASVSALTNYWQSEREGIARLRQDAPRLYAELLEQYKKVRNGMTRRAK